MHAARLTHPGQHGAPLVLVPQVVGRQPGGAGVACGSGGSAAQQRGGQQGGELKGLLNDAAPADGCAAAVPTAHRTTAPPHYTCWPGTHPLNTCCPELFLTSRGREGGCGIQCCRPQEPRVRWHVPVSGTGGSARCLPGTSAAQAMLCMLCTPCRIPADGRVPS